MKSWPAHYYETFRLALPLMIGQIAMISIWNADVIMMGWINTDSIAAGGQASRLYQPFYFVALGLTVAVAPLTAQALGGGSRRQARRVIRQGIWLACLYGVIAFFPMWYGEHLLIFLGQEKALAENASLFLKMTAFGMLPTFVFFALRNFISAYQKPMPPVYVTIAGAILNVALNYILINGSFGLPELGLAGIGLATSLTFALMALALLIYVASFPPFRFTRPFARMYTLDFEVMRQILVLGIPIAFMLLAETGMFIFAGLYTGIFGSNAVAASVITIQIAATAFMLPLAMGQAATIRVGHAAGASNRPDTIRAAVTPIIITIGFCVPLTFLLIYFNEAAINLFLNPADIHYQSVLALAIPMLLVVAFFQIFDGLQIVFSCVLRGISDTRVPAIISIISYWGVGVVMAVVLASWVGLGPIGVWWGMLLGLAAGSALLGWRCFAMWRNITRGGKILVM